MYSEDMNSGATAMTRTKVSAPTQWLLDNYALYGDVIHYGEGKAFQDTEAIGNLEGVDSVFGYDPNSIIPDHRTRPVGCLWDYSVSNYVLNTLTLDDREEALIDQFVSSLSSVITVRIDKVKGTPFQDGVSTSKGTFQAQLTAAEWIAWMVTTLNYRGFTFRRIMILNQTRSYLMLEVL